MTPEVPRTANPMQKGILRGGEIRAGSVSKKLCQSVKTINWMIRTLL
jgi:hypothetical protein